MAFEFALSHNFADEMTLAIASGCCRSCSVRWDSIRKECNKYLSIIVELKHPAPGSIPNLVPRIQKYVTFHAATRGIAKHHAFETLWDVVCATFCHYTPKDRDFIVQFRYSSRLHDLLDITWCACFVTYADPRPNSPGDDYVWHGGYWVPWGRIYGS